jgi:SAM-dependent MidA family methyltransferase
MNPLASENNNPELCAFITQKIEENPQKRITFAEYMDWVLYHPDYGYYSTNKANIGKHGDFLTSPRLSADFGEVLGEQFVEMWEILGKPHNFTLGEMGAGQGILAADILHYLQNQYSDFFHCLQYIIIEKSPALIAEQKKYLRDYQSLVKWQKWDDIADTSIVGCFFSNELIDAFPVHQFVIQDSKIQEIYLTGESASLREILDDVSTTQIIDYFDLLGIDLSTRVYGEGYRSEVNLAALAWIKTVTSKLQRGYLLTIDYGYPAHRYYNPYRREGTLQCYYRHRHHNDPYINIGNQDITAHVNFTALEKQGELSGLAKIGSTQQCLFLMALGLGDRVSALSTKDAEVLDIGTFLKRRDALHQLIDPMGLGGFEVLLQCQGLTDSEKTRSIKGFTIPI